jgi:S1-C subfamily serine protease
MLKNFLVVTVLAGISVTAGDSSAQTSTQSSYSRSTADIAAGSIPATVTIVTIGADGDTIAQGSGFLIRQDGVIVTNFHVMRGASTASVTLATRERFDRVRVLDADSALDLAILKIPGAGLPALIPRTTIPRVGERVVAIGTPLGLTNSVSEGIVSASRVVRGRELVQITAPISHGSSGGAVLDADGRVFAVSTLQIVGGQSLNFAVPVRYALGLLQDAQSTRTVSEVFGSLGTDDSEQDGNTSTRSENDGSKRAVQPRSSVAGTYVVAQTWFDKRTNSPTLKQSGYLMATENVGVLVLASVNDKYETDGPTTVYRVKRWATNTAGDVVLAAGGAEYDGYQTEDGGFSAKAQLSAEETGTFVLSMGAIPQRLPLSRNDGLFSVTLRTFYHPGSDSRSIGDALDWTGDEVVAFAHDSIFVALFLTNDRGGTTAFSSEGPIHRDGSFDLWTPSGSRLYGHLAAGVMTADWIDKRDLGSFVGTLRADRR